jgi:MFS family permease
VQPPRSPLQIPDFRLYWLARFCAVLATMGMVVILAYQVYDVARADYGMTIREASFQLGLLGLFQFVPLAVLTPLAGWVADRYERRTVARLANAVDMGVALALGWLTTNDALTLPVLLAMAACHGVARVFVAPAMSSIGPNIVPAALLPRAIAMSSIAWQSASVAGPALGGFLYAKSPAAPYWAAAALMLIAMLAITPIRRIVPPPMDAADGRNGKHCKWRTACPMFAITAFFWAPSPLIFLRSCSAARRQCCRFTRVTS